MNLKVKIPNIDWTLDISKFYIIEKRMLVTCLFFMSMLILYFGSLHPWFMWPLMEYYKVFAGCLAVFAILIDNSSEQRLLTRGNLLLPMLIFVILSYLILFVNNYSAGSYLIEMFVILDMFLILRAEEELMTKCITFICKVMAVMLCISMFFYVLYLFGFGMPSRSAVFGDNNYSFTNYYFFMIDDRALWTLIPRFHSVFLEPGHLGGATSMLLLTQMGQWKKWYNIVLIITSIVTFSLAAYAFMFTLVFLNLWVQRKNIIGKIIMFIIFIAISATTAFFYNGGDNMVNNLILMRLEVNDKTGDIEGNNRVSEDFEKEFDSFMTSSDVFTGREFSKVNDEHGNSGYRVFIYENGLIVTVLVFLFYTLTFASYKDRRFLLASVILALMMFWVRGYPLWYSNYIPLLATTYLSSKRKDLISL